MTPQPNEPTAAAIDAALRRTANGYYVGGSSTTFWALLTDDNQALAQAVTDLRVENAAAKREASYLAEVIFKKHYARADGAVKWGLCDTTAGIISQIDNMFAGVAERLVIAETELAALRAENERLKAGDTYYHRYNETLERLSDSMDENRHLRAEWEVRESQLRASLSIAVDALEAARDFVANVRSHNIPGQGEWHTYTDASFRVLRDALAQQRPLLAGKGNT